MSIIKKLFGNDPMMPKVFLISLMLISLISALVYTYHPIRKIEQLESALGANKYSQFHEELFIRDFFQDKKSGFFIDIGANHYKINSTSYYLEKHLNWKGIAVDPLVEYADDYQKFRPNTNFLTYFISDKSDVPSVLYKVLSNPRLSSSNVDELKGFEKKKIEVTSLTLNDLLIKQKVKNIDFLSMDIELSELEALKGFDIEKYKPKLVCIEVHELVKKGVYQYFKAHNYVEIKKYSLLDPLNAYFKPQA